MNLISAIRQMSWQQRTLFAGVAGLALAGANALVARRTEKRYPPQGLFLNVNGTRLHYSDRGEGTPIVLIHGNAVTGGDWNTSGVADLLLRTHRVIIFDRPGFGHSERPRGKVWTAIRQADLIHDALLQLGVERPVVVGHSLGTIVALALAERYQADIAGLVLLSGTLLDTTSRRAAGCSRRAAGARRHFALHRIAPAGLAADADAKMVNVLAGSGARPFPR
jgi:pimeloyl-ACP methyl ester carboxylesterase